jgi:hypothetical protein
VRLIAEKIFGPGKFVTSEHDQVTNDAIDTNSQIRRSFGVPEKIRQIAKQFES